MGADMAGVARVRAKATTAGVYMLIKLMWGWIE